MVTQTCHHIALGNGRQNNHTFMATLDYMRPCFKTKPKPNNKTNDQECWCTLVIPSTGEAEAED